MDEPVVRDRPQGVVGRTVASSAEPVAMTLSTAGLHWAGTAQSSERGVAVQPVRVRAGGDEQLRRTVNPDAWSLEQLRGGSSDELTDEPVQLDDLGVQV